MTRSNNFHFASDPPALVVVPSKNTESHRTAMFHQKEGGVLPSAADRLTTMPTIRRGIGDSVADYDITPPPDRLTNRVQLRTAFTAERGEVRRFMTQLEFWLDDEWTEVVRYDHDHDTGGGHNVAEEGLHRDIYRNGVKHDVKQVTGPIQANEAFSYAEEDLYENTEQYIRRFKQWHGVSDTTNR